MIRDIEIAIHNAIGRLANRVHKRLAFFPYRYIPWIVPILARLYTLSCPPVEHLADGEDWA